MKSSRVRRRRRLWSPVFALAVMLVAIRSGVAAAPEPEAKNEGALDVSWVKGPATGQLGSIATVNVPEKFLFAGPDDTRKIMEAMHNPTNGSEMGFVAPVEGNWFIVFEYEGTGHVKDDEHASLDADKIMSSLRASQEEGNKDRAKHGWETLELTGWMQPPRYDPDTHNLEWATRLRSSTTKENVNYNSRLLGREGVMSATLVGDEKDIQENLAIFKDVLRGHTFVAGQKYTEFRAGDKVAKYGLTALITGGAAAVALKTGLLAKFWKLIVLAVAGGASALKKLFGKSKSPAPDEPAAT